MMLTQKRNFIKESAVPFSIGDHMLTQYVPTDSAKKADFQMLVPLFSDLLLSHK